MSRDEFNAYSRLTGDDEVSDAEWMLLQNNFVLENDQLTKKVFIDLHQMEANDSSGNTDDMWLSLNNIGYNNQIELNQVILKVIQIMKSYLFIVLSIRD
jgi:hypothetical protein